MRKKLKKSNKISIILFLIIVGIFCSYIIISTYSKKINDIFFSSAESKVTQLMTLVINKSIDQEIITLIDDDNLFNVIEDNQGNIKLVDFNSAGVTNLLKILTNKVTINLKMIESGNVAKLDIDTDYYNVNNLQKGIIYQIPIGAITNSSFLSNLGPKIPVKMKLIGDITSNISTNIKEYGINNAILEVGVKVNVSSMINLPFASKKITVSSTIPISLKILQGNIPNYYLNGIKNDSSLYGLGVD